MVEKLLIFQKRDFLYDNGLVNMFLTLKQDPRFDNISERMVKYKNTEILLNNLEMKISGKSKEIEEIYFILRSIYYSNVFEETDNNKPYYDPEKNKVVIRPVLNVKPFLQRSERTKDLLPTISVSEKKFEELKKEEEEAKKIFEGKISGKLQYGSRGTKVFTYLRPNMLGDNISGKVQDFIKGESCAFCNSKYTKYLTTDGKKKSFSITSTNLIFDFGTGDKKPCFRDYRSKNDISICFFCDLIYRYGLTKNYFVNNNVFIVSGPSLNYSHNLKITLRINDEPLPVESRLKTNFLEKGSFAATDISSRLLVLLFKIYNKIISRDELAQINVFYFIVTSRGIDDLRNYNRMSYISKLFNKTNDIKSGDPSRPFLNQLINYAYYKNITKFETKNRPREILTGEILNGMPIDSTIMDLSYYNMALDNPSILNPILLYEFLKEYLEVIGMVELKKLHEISMIVGNRIGYFAATSNNKTLLYQLREIGNLEGLTEFFKDLEYEILKEDAGAIWNKKLDDQERYSDYINKILNDVQSNRDTLLARNYLGIYAVQKYLSTKYAKGKGGS